MFVRDKSTAAEGLNGFYLSQSGFAADSIYHLPAWNGVLAAIPVIIINCGSTENYILRALFAQRGIDVIWPIVIFPLIMDAVYRFTKRLI